MEVFIATEKLLGFVVLPVVLTSLTVFSCGNARPKHALKMTSDSQKVRAKLEQSKSDKSGSKKEFGSKESRKLRKTQKTRSTESQSKESLSQSRKEKRSSLKPCKLAKPLPASGIRAEKSAKTNKKSEEMVRKTIERRDLKMEPEELRWNTSGGIQKVFISNPTDIRRAVKVKCSDNTLYRVNPVYSFVEPGQVLTIDILRQNGGAKVDKMVFLAAMASKDDENPRSVFQDNLPKPMMILPLIATANKA